MADNATLALNSGLCFFRVFFFISFAFLVGSKLHLSPWSELGAALFGDIDLANRRGEGGHADGPSMAGWWSVGRPDRGRGDCGRARHFRGRSSNPRSQHWSAGSEV